MNPSFRSRPLVADSGGQPVASGVVRPPKLSGSVIGRFSVSERLGGGGMGEVYRAYDTMLERTVALKRIVRTGNEEDRQRLWNEARFACQLNDPRIAAVYDVFEENGELYLVMEHVDGQTLRRRLDEPISIAKFLDIGMECAEGLAAAHKSGVLHRDIKPENIMLTPAGQVKILDFGVAGRLPNSTMTSTEIEDRAENKGFSGTLAYMAPEVLQETEADERSDIFSLGVIFYEVLAGRHPFYAKGFLATCNRIVNEDPRPLRQFNPRVSPELERIVNKMLAKDPGQRYVSAADLLVDLRALRRTSNAQAISATGITSKRRRWSKGRMLIVGLAPLMVWLLTAIYFKARHNSAPAFSAHDWLLVADFENRSGETLFDDTVAESLGHALQQSRYVDIVPRARAVEAARLAGRSDVSRLDPQLGRLLCERENYRALLAGEVIKAGTGYQVNVRIIDPLQNATVLRDSISLSSPNQLYARVDELAKRLRGRLGESLGQIERQSTPQERVTTPSLEALRRYSAGMKRYTAGDVDGFITLAKSAVEFDPDFAMAHLSLAEAYGALGNEKESRVHLALAVKGIGRVSERERYLIQATDYSARALEEQALQQFRLLTELYPDDAEGLRGFAKQAMLLGHKQDAIQTEKRLLQIDPHSSLDRNRLILWLDRDSKFDEALSAFSSAKEYGVNGAVLHWGAGLAFLGQDDAAKARQQFEAMAQEGGDYEKVLAALYSARVLIYQGKLSEATDALHSAIFLTERLHFDVGIPVERYLLAEVLALRGRPPEARAELHRLIDAIPPAETEETELRRAGLLAVSLGEFSTGRQMLARLAKLRESQDNSLTHSSYFTLKGALELAEGKADAAVLSEKRSEAFLPTFGASDSLAGAYNKQHRWAEAVGTYQRYLNFKGEMLMDDDPADWILGNLRLARVLAHSGDLQQSIRYYDRFLGLWANADSDVPILRQARDERTHLAGNLARNDHGKS